MLERKIEYQYRTPFELLQEKAGRKMKLLKYVVALMLSMPVVAYGKDLHLGKMDRTDILV